MSLNRVLRYLNWFIALILIAALAAVYWFVWRVLPQVSGELQARLRAEARVVRDSHGVPHIRAASLEDAVFLQGYVTAQDRLWQMDGLRRLAGGTLAEIAGPAALELDRESRRLRMRRLAEQHQRTLDPKLRALFAAYARGVNHFIETHRHALPAEFTLMRYDPAPWSITDSILAGMQMFLDLTTTWKEEYQKATLMAGGDAKLVAQLFPARAARDVMPGSNAWVVSGKLTADGKPLLANDTHLQWRIPSTWYMVHLESPEANVAGFSLPGLPAVIIGHNDRVAWGVTNLGFDVQDLYAERMDLRSGQYAYRGQLMQAAREAELIPVKGQRASEFTNFVTVHGPVWRVEGQRVLTLKWVAQEVFDFPFFELNAARDCAGFREVLRKFVGPGQNFVFADVDGNIAYQAAGRLPVRKTYTGDMFADGASGEQEWDGFIPFEELPHAMNPPGGMLVTANQIPFPPDYKYPATGMYAPQYRAEQIRDLLRKGRAFRPEDMVTIQKDVYSPFHHFLATELVKAYEGKAKGDEALSGPVELLRNWNGQMEKGLAAPMIAALVYSRLRGAVGERASPARGREYEALVASSVIERLLRERSTEWFADWDAALVKALRDGLEDGRASQGRNPAKWDYGRYIELELPHPVARQVPWLGSYFQIGPAAMSGAGTTVKQTSRRVGPSMRFVAAVGDWDRSLMSVTIGQSGQFLSPHYKDQWEPYWAGRSLPAAYRNVSGKELRVRP